MPFSQEVFEFLSSMGIAEPLAKEAATRYSKLDVAADWCFGAGQLVWPGMLVAKSEVLTSTVGSFK
jgi:hypothetical protein